MKKTILALALALTPSLAYAKNNPQPASTFDWDTPSSPLCTDWSAAFIVDCLGSYEGNNEGGGQNPPGETETFNKINAYWGSYSSFGAGQSISTFNTSTQKITFSEYLQGYHVIALKQSTRFSLYLVRFGSGGVNELTYSTIGVNGAPGTDVSHVTLYEGSGSVDCIPSDPQGCCFQTPTAPGCTPVPEPNSYLLMASGLAGLGYLARRRRTNA